MKVNFKEISGEILNDTATGGTCYNCCITVKDYIEIIKDRYKDSNVFQREIMNIKSNRIYLKLVKDLLKGVVIPTISLYLENSKKISDGMDIKPVNLKILDGLQRTNCLMYVYNYLKGNDQLAFDFVSQPSKMTLKEFEQKVIRIEIWVKLTVTGILYKMVSLNAGQTPMRIQHQLEVLELPLYEELHKKGLNISRHFNKKDDAAFFLSTIVECFIAYNFETTTPNKQESAIQFLDNLDIYNNKHESVILKNEQFMKDLLWVLTDLHQSLMKAYDFGELKNFKYYLSNQNSFLIPLVAALGKARVNDTQNLLDKRKINLINLLKSKKTDPLELFTYRTIVDSFKSGIGSKVRKLVFMAFYQYFGTKNSVEKIDWLFAKELI